jgi:hypothetical protein
MNTHTARHVAPLVATATLFLAGCTDDTTGATRTESTGSPSSSPTDDSPWKLLSAQGEGAALEPGLYALEPNGSSDRLAVIRAPEGYEQLGGWTFVAGEPFVGEEPFRAMGFQTAVLVPPDPCGSKAHSKFDAEVDPGPSVQDLADALLAQKGAETSEPAPVTIDGHQGLYLTYEVGKGIDVSKCEANAFDIFSTGRGAWYLETAREQAAIWILRVGGERLVLAWVAFPGVSAADKQEMTRMVRSARFVDAEQSVP